METKDKKDKIYKEAIRLIKNKDLRFTFDDLANNLHMAKKTIYKFFKSKNELAEWLYSTSISDFNKELLAQKTIISEENSYELFLCYSILLTICDKKIYEIYSLNESFYNDINEKFEEIEKIFFGYLSSTNLKRFFKNETFKYSINATLVYLYRKNDSNSLIKDYVMFLGELQ